MKRKKQAKKVGSGGDDESIIDPCLELVQTLSR